MRTRRTITPYLGSHTVEQEKLDEPVDLFGDVHHIEPGEIDYKHELGELLCVLHRDGGHYIEEHGMRKAIIDAHKAYYDRATKIDELEQRLKDIEGPVSVGQITVIE